MLADTLERVVENDTHGSLVQWVERSSPRSSLIVIGDTHPSSL